MGSSGSEILRLPCGMPARSMMPFCTQRKTNFGFHFGFSNFSRKLPLMVFLIAVISFERARSIDDALL